MPRRLLLAAVATLSTLPLLTACHGSPEAGRPNTTPTSTTPSPTPTPTAPSTPTWTPEEQAAITAAKARYAAALAAIDKTLNDPTKPSRPPLEAAGLSDKRILDAIGDARTLRDSGWYRAGKAQIRSVTATAVDLSATQPKVTLRSCVDFSSAVLHFQNDHKVVPITASSSKRVTFSAELRYTARSAASTKMWFLTDEKTIGSC